MKLFRILLLLASEGGANNEDPAITARDIVAHLGSAHPDFPFYWYRAVFKQPSWFVSVHDLVQQQRSDAVWMSAPDFFELLRCYAEETGSVVPKAF